MRPEPIPASQGIAVTRRVPTR
ncbi:hypothetical protein MELA_01929, partial [Candidatus Methylomirabilis lanthanidiphila]